MTPADFLAWRKRLGMTQAQAATALGLSHDWVRSAEIGRRPISPVVDLACREVERSHQQHTSSPAGTISAAVPASAGAAASERRPHTIAPGRAGMT